MKHSENIIQPFLIDHTHIRGRVVQLGSVVDTILNRHKYPQAVSHLLAEMLVIAAMLSSNLKDQGILTLQAKGDGPISLLVVDATHDGRLRGYADIVKERRGEVPRYSRKKPPTLRQMMGQGYLAITLDQGDGPDGRYQGIVELAETTISNAIREYFIQSQQVEMAIKLLVDKHAETKNGPGIWFAGGVMIERLPQEGGHAANDAHTADEAADQWARTTLFMETVSADELLGPRLDSWAVLQRLFGEDGVWAYPPHTLHTACRCSRERVAGVLRGISLDELRTMLVRGKLSVNCQFCNSTQEFSEAELGSI